MTNFVPHGHNIVPFGWSEPWSLKVNKYLSFISRQANYESGIRDSYPVVNGTAEKN